MSYNIALKSRLDARELLLLEQEVKSNGKNMVVGYVLWYFLGLFGGHRFYMKKKGSAIAQLILSLTLVGMIVTSIWCLVDAFLLHTWIKEHNRAVESRIMDQIMTQKHA